MAQVLAGIRGPSPPFDGESVDIEPMNVPHRSRMDSTRTVLDEIYAPTIPGSVDLPELEEVPIPAPQRPQRRMGYFDLHPERWHVQVGGDGGDMLDDFAQAAGGAETPPRRSDTTESVYSSGPTPPASPKQALTRLNTERLHPNPTVGSLSPLPLCQLQRRAHRHRHILHVTCNDSRRCATDCQASPGRRRAR